MNECLDCGYVFGSKVKCPMCGDEDSGFGFASLTEGRVHFDEACCTCDRCKEGQSE